MKVCILKAGYKCLCCIQTGKNIDTCLDCISTDHKSVFLMLDSLRRSIDNNIDLMSKKKIMKRSFRSQDVLKHLVIVSMLQEEPQRFSKKTESKQSVQINWSSRHRTFGPDSWT